MGVTISQYRAAIGHWNRRIVHGNSYIKETSNHLNDENTKNVIGLFIIVSLVFSGLLNSVVTDQNLSMSIMSMQCLQALLVISGVEQNPGPMSQQSIIEELSSKSPNEVINKVLKAYPIGQTLGQQKNAINKFKKEELITTLEFLKVTNQENYNKPQILHNLIVRIQNLLPDICGLCKNEYHTDLDETPLLTCEVCGQGSHNTCIISILGLEGEDKNSIDPKRAKKMIIPLELPGVHYLCMTCSNDYIPDENESILKKTVQESPVEETTPDRDQTPETAEVEQVAPETINPPGSVDTQSQPVHNNGSQPSPQSSSQTQSPNQGSDGRFICQHYRKGQCKHGFRGRGCKNLHPQPCKKLMRHGNKAPNGCIMGRLNCEKFHPNMCPHSITKGECTDSSCKLWHVAGTRKNQRNIPTTSRNSMGVKNHGINQKPVTGKSEDFLGLLQSWKAEMMEAMDTKLSMALKPSIVPSPRPAMEALPMMAQNHILPQSYYNLSVGGQRNLMTSNQPVLLQMSPNVMYH